MQTYILRGIKRGCGLTIVAFALSGCMSSPSKPDDTYAATMPPVYQPRVVNNGAIYQNDTVLPLFEDLKARRPGDILTIVLTENTNATKSASTSTSKETDIDLGTPTILGQTITHKGDNLLGANVGTSHEFEGEGDSSQSNNLSGTISVTVQRVLPNGNLVIRGEKRLVLNQGEEYIQVAGIVRPVDISSNNTVPSTQIADAHITYSGRGAIAESNTMGWLSRFFIGAIWPF